MCGIFGIVSKTDDAANLTFKGLSDIEYRGYDSWGVAYFNNNHFKVEKNIGFLPKQLNFPKTPIAIGHTRWATHGGVTIANAHPHLDCSKKIALVHNGIVENYIDLKTKLKKHVFKSETDTEIIVHMIEEEYSKSKDLVSCVIKVFKKLSGFNAFVVTDGKQLVACRNGSPLVVGNNNGQFIVASDPNAILPHTNNLIFLEDNQLISMDQDFKVYDLATEKKVDVNFKPVPWKHTTSDLNGYPHFMIKEILEQPNVIRDIAKNSKDIDSLVLQIKKAYGTYAIGCGSAAYACIAAIYLFSKFAKKHINFSVGSEFNYIEDYLTSKSLLIAVSQSGETIDTVEPVGLAKNRKTRIVALTNTTGSTLYRMADDNLSLRAGVEKAVASTKALTAMLAYMVLISLAVAGKKKMGEKILKQSAKEIETIIDNKAKIIQLADKLAKSEHIYILGRGLSYPVALESALKIKEVSYIHAEGFAAGELKHGFLALISPKTPVIVYLANDETQDAVMANAMEVKARGAYLIGVGFKNDPVFDYYFPVKDTGASSILPHVVFAQLLAYYLAIKLRKNPDKPRNLAKSVVVR